MSNYPHSAFKQEDTGHQIRNQHPPQIKLQSAGWGQLSISLNTLYAIAPDSGDILLLQPGSSGVWRLASMPRGGGRLSGVALDTEGGVWTTQRDGWSLVRFDAEGN